jgi:16S rRNA (uracil1498-N3)-methyltransferase
MQRFFLPPDQTSGDLLTLEDREAHHALHVVRLRPRETVVVLNGQGERIRCEAADLERRRVRLRVIEREKVPSRDRPVTLIQAVPKGKTFDTIVQKATELGVGRIIPLLSQRVVSQIDEERGHTKLDHWRAIAIESIKQCGAPWLPALDIPISLPALLPVLGPAVLKIVASLRPNARHPRKVIESAFAEAAAASPGEIQVWIGPEGDFTDEELATLESAGVQPITLGSLVLRADTAAIYVMSILNYEAGR